MNPIGNHSYDLDINFGGFLLKFYDENKNLFFESSVYIKPKKFVYELDITDDHFYYHNYVNFFREPTYERHNLGEYKTIFDVGANIGLFSIFIKKNKNEQVYAFEPCPTCEEVYRRVNPSYTYFPFAVSDKSKIVNFTVNRVSEISKIESQSNQSSIKVNAYSLEDCLEMTKNKTIDLLKMDVEGEEYNIILNTPNETMKKFELLLIDYHPPYIQSHKEFISKIIETHPNMEIDTRNRTLSARKS